MNSQADLNSAVYGSSLGEGFETFMTSVAKRRRFSVRSLERFFMNACADAAITDVIECGANDGRHTDRFLGIPDLTVHAFEPNVFLGHHWLARSGHERLRFNAFALGPERSKVQFNIPVANGAPVGGISSFSEHNRYTEAVKINVFVEAAQTYISDLDIDPKRLAIWIDVEGNADIVLQGFGPRLAEVSVALIEVETHRHYGRDPSLSAVASLLEEMGMKIVARDWMNHGQCNILACRSDVAPKLEEVVQGYTEKILALAESHRLKPTAGA